MRERKLFRIEATHRRGVSTLIRCTARLTSHHPEGSHGVGSVSIARWAVGDTDNLFITVIGIGILTDRSDDH
ncbi:hypothetical protein J6590_037932, partial [Homalodisca vitripennis]